MTLELLGPIGQVQLQPVSIKQGRGSAETYHPRGLLPVECLLFDGQGIQGVTVEGEQRLDVHHPAHPASRFRGKNGISLGFTAHYEAMCERFGAHMTLGCAAENIIIRTAERITLERLRRYVLIHNRASDGWLVLTGTFVAEPCLPFARFAIEHTPTPSEIKAALQFLHQGTRGFYVTLDPASTTNIAQVGDPVYVADEIPADIGPRFAP